MSGREPVPASVGDVPPPGGDPLAPRLAASVDHWKRRLLDLSKRNRALHFRMTRVSTLAVVSEEPTEVFRQLCLEGGAMRFRGTEADAGGRPADGSPGPSATSEPAGDRAGGPAADAGPVDADADEAPLLASPDFRPYDPAQLDPSRTDRVLQTTSTPAELDRSLRRIDEQARLAIDEQGVNTLFLTLGMLHYRESPDPEPPFRAPLILVPVALERKSARSAFTVRATDDDPMVNLALVEYLRRASGIVLPELPEGERLGDDYDLQAWFRAATDAISGQAGWAVKNEIYLGLFSFQKLVMYTDLEAHGEAFVRHRLVRQLVARSGTELGLPDEIRALRLDRESPPESTFQVVDADGSQLMAMAAVSRGHDLVLEGPPGTGKSQTITNLIAQALAAGKSVLFVSEKMAALEVVYRRLVQAGLGEFCLELHSTKANKKTVMREIAAALDASLTRPRPPGVSAARLPTVREELTRYAEAVHAPHGALGLSPYRVYGELGAVRAAPKLPWSGSTQGITLAQLEEAERDLADLRTAAAEVGTPASSPWRDARRTFYAEADLDAIQHGLASLRPRLAELLDRAREAEQAFGLPPIRTFADVETAGGIGALLARSPGVPVAVLGSEAWDAPPPPALALVASGRTIAELRERVAARFVPAVTAETHAADIRDVEVKLRGPWRWLALLDGRYRAIRRRWRAYRLPSYTAGLLDQAQEMKRVDHLQAERASLHDRESAARALFGERWQGEASDWDALETYIRWVVDFRQALVRHGLREPALRAASPKAPDVSTLTALRELAATVATHLGALRQAVGWPPDYLAQAPLEELAARAAALATHLDLAPRWATFELARAKVAAGIAGELLPPAMRGEVAFEDLPAALRRAFLQTWLAEVVRERPPLHAFHTLTHEHRVAEFRALDEAILVANRAALGARLRDTLQARLRAPDLAAPMAVLRREMARQRGLQPLRVTMRHAEAAIRAIKPCFMMSPLSVAQLLDGAAPSFDLVVFDEASQLPPEDAIAAIARGRQAVVVGDPKQLPPTDFFRVLGGAVRAAVDAEGTPLYTDSESVLEELLGSGVPKSRLRWHYRSAHESLITFSNLCFYDGDLRTFPSVETETAAHGLSFEHVPDGVYEGQGLNPIEARRVADAVIRHARAHPGLSLGVGTFNLRQQLLIQDELEARRRQDPGVEPFFARSAREPFFVKNLENLQGDERDVIFISVTYAKGADGRLRQNFGPLNGVNGWRRLNVLTTRARRRMRVFASMQGEEIAVTDGGSDGPRLLREFLLFAEHGRLERAPGRGAAEPESPFERDVRLELTRRGLRLAPQVGVAGRRIDFGVLDDAVPGRFVCGIECDGAAYHAADTASDRDRLRAQVLEARGWTIHRVWSTDWFKDRAGQVERLLRLVAETRERLRQEPPAPARADREATASSAAASAAGPFPATTSDPEGPAPPADRPTYVRPAAAPYRVTEGDGPYAGQDILDATTAALTRAITAVVAAEAPLHVTDLTARVAGMWGAGRVGSRIAAKIAAGLRAAAQAGLAEARGEFVWAPSGACLARSRADTGIPADRIAPEEYHAATTLILQAAGSLPRADLIGEVRALLGFSRTGPVLEEAIGAAIDALLTAGAAGEGSGGIALRPPGA